MTFFIGPECIDINDRGCVDVCPVDCIYTGERKLYIHPEECIDCGACETVCPQLAIRRREDVDDPDLLSWADEDVKFFAEPLSQERSPLGSPGEAQALGPVGLDTERVRAYKQSDHQSVSEES